MTIRIKAIVATQPDLGIGADNELLFSIKTDLQLFKRKTEGAVVVMGRKTYESLPNGPLPNRTNIVISSQGLQNAPEGVLVAKTPLEALQLAKAQERASYGIWVIGGASIYKALLPYCEELHQTELYENVENIPDTYLQPLADHWVCTRVDVVMANNGDPDYKISVFKNTRQLVLIDPK